MSAQIAGLVVILSFVFPVTSAVMRYRRLDAAMKVFAIFCIFYFAIEILEFVLMRMHINNTSESNYFVPIEVMTMCVVYVLSTQSKKIKKTLSIITTVFMCIWLVDKIYFEVPGLVNNEMALTSRIVIVLLSVVTINVNMKNLDHPFTDEPIFWVSIGTIIYSAGVAVLIGSINELAKLGLSVFNSVWYINWVLEILCNLIFTKGFLCKAKYQI
jgi:hypothetical protein